MAEFVLAKDKETGHHVWMPVAQFEHEGDVWEELDRGRSRLPTKFYTSVSKEATKKKTTQSKKATQSAANIKKEK